MRCFLLLLLLYVFGVDVVGNGVFYSRELFRKVVYVCEPLSVDSRRSIQYFILIILCVFLCIVRPLTHH